jgi:hypothetical protein
MNEILETLSKASSAAWIGLVGVVVGAVISIFGVWLTNRSSIKQLNIQLEHEKSTRADALKREKLEELYILVDKWLDGIFNHYLKLTLVMRGEIDYNQYLDQVIEEGKKNTVDFSRLGMIVDIYAHELQSSYKKIMEARSEINKISAAHKRAYKAGDFNGEKYLKPYTDAQIKLEELTELFKKNIAEHAKNA